VEVIINELVSRIKLLDGDRMLSPDTLNRIVATVMDAVRDEMEHRQRVHDEHSLDNVHERAERDRYYS
jgi:hypothetical protein